MEFTTLKEYFYKLQNALYFTLLIPLTAFIILYLRTNEGLVDEEQSMLILSFLVLLTILDWLIGFILFKLRLKKILQQSSLRTRLEQYYALTIVRSCFHVIACLMPVVGYFITADPRLAYAFGAVLILFFIFWPGPAKVCRDLKLKGDERDMVFHKKG